MRAGLGYLSNGIEGGFMILVRGPGTASASKQEVFPDYTLRRALAAFGLPSSKRDERVAVVRRGGCGRERRGEDGDN